MKKLNFFLTPTILIATIGIIPVVAVSCNKEKEVVNVLVNEWDVSKQCLKSQYFVLDPNKQYKVTFDFNQIQEEGQYIEGAFWTTSFRSSAPAAVQDINIKSVYYDSVKLENNTDYTYTHGTLSLNAKYYPNPEMKNLEITFEPDESANNGYILGSWNKTN